MIDAELVGMDKECVPQTSERVQMCTIKFESSERMNCEERKGQGRGLEAAVGRARKRWRKERQGSLQTC